MERAFYSISSLERSMERIGFLFEYHKRTLMIRNEHFWAIGDFL